MEANEKVLRSMAAAMDEASAWSQGYLIGYASGILDARQHPKQDDVALSAPS